MDACVQLLLAHPDVNVNKADQGGLTPLHIAAGLGYDVCVQFLLAHPDVHVSLAGKNVWTPLMTSVLGYTKHS